MKFKESGSISDTERLNSDSHSFSNSFDIFSTEANESTDNNTNNSKLHQPLPLFTDKETFSTEVTILASPNPFYENKRHNGRLNCYYSIFDPLLAYNSLPKILISISGMLLTGFFLNIIIVHINMFTYHIHEFTCSLYL